MLPFLVTMGLAAALSVAATPLFASLARRSGLVVAPRSDRWHKAATPLLGGAAIAAGSLVALAVALPSGRTALVLILCAGAAFALGLLDDFRGFAPATKLVGQVMLGAALFIGGIQVEIVSFPPIAFLLTIFWIMAMMNALNLMDNMDGLAAGIAAIAALMLGLTAEPTQPAAAIAAAATGGAALGFLVHNFSPARVFMGDAGSLLLGFMLAATALLHTASGAANLGLAVIAPIAVLALPIFDTALVTASRRSAGRSISQGGRDHTSHRLAALGLSDRGAVLFLYGIAAMLAVVGAIADTVSGLGLALAALSAVGLVLFGLFLHDVDVYGGPAPQHTDADLGAPALRAIWGRVRFGAEVGLDVVLLTVAYYASYFVRFEGIPESLWLYLFTQSVPIVVGAQLAVLVALRVYRTLWRYLGVGDLVAILRALAIGTAIGALGLLLLYRFEGYSRAVFVFDLLLASVLLIGARSFALWLRQWFAGRPRSGERRVLIVGATERGAVALRLLAHAASGPYRAIGFLDDDPGKRYRRVGGVAVVGTTRDLEAVVRRLSPDLVVLAVDADPADVDRLRARCEGVGVEHRELLTPV